MAGTKAAWTEERREKQRLLIQETKPWLRSTGPRTPEGIWHSERDPITGEEKRTQKRLHDLRGTFATRIVAQANANLTNNEVAERMGWSPQQVDQIRKKYVDDRAIVSDLTRRLRGGA